MPVAPRVTILNIDRLVLFSTIRAWASGMIFVGAIALLAHSFLLYATDFRFASALYGWVILAYAALAAGVGGFKASVTISAAATAVLIGLLVVDTELIKGQDPLALIFVGACVSDLESSLATILVNPRLRYFPLRENAARKVLCPAHW